MASDYQQPVNLGNPGEFKIIELAEIVLRLVKSKSKLRFTALPADDPKQRCPNISLARRVLGWEPKINLEQGLMKAIPYFRAKLKS